MEVMLSSDNSNRVGLMIFSIDSIRVFLSGASNSKDTTLSDELRRTSDIPYAPLRALWIASNPSTRPDLTRLFSGTQRQGLHVVVTMFTGYLVGYAAFRALFNHSPTMNAAGGILGLVGAMLVETFLFILRSSNADANKTRKFSKKPRPSLSTSSVKKNQ